MSYILGSYTLPNPKKMDRDPIEISQTNTTLTGRTRKKLIRRKWRYTLKYLALTEAAANAIMAIYAQNTTQTFVVADGNLTISTTVHIDITEREYPPTGKAYREDFDIILTEV